MPWRSTQGRPAVNWAAGAAGILMAKLCPKKTLTWLLPTRYAKQENPPSIPLAQVDGGGKLADYGI